MHLCLNLVLEIIHMSSAAGIPNDFPEAESV